MNAIATLLAEKAIKTHFPLTLPTIDDIVEVQEAMLIHIPPELKDYLLYSSDAIYGDLEPITIADPNNHTYLPEVAAQSWERGLPREMIPLCIDRDKIYCVSEDGAVHVWLEEFGEQCQPMSDDIWQWVRDIWLRA